MTCDGSFGEGYALYVLGALEVTERQEIQSHVDLGCETCQAALKANLEMWSAYSVVFAPSDVVPPATLRQRILKAIAGSNIYTMRPRNAVPIWRQPIAAALLLAAGGGLGWLGHLYLKAPVPVVRQTPAPGGVSSDEVARLQARVDALQRDLTAASARVAEAQRSAADTTRASDSQKQVLASAQTQLDQTRALFADASRKLTQAETDLRQNQVLLASAQRAREDAEQRLRGAVDDRARAVAERDQLAQRERTLLAQNQELQKQIVSYQQVVERQSGQVAPLLRLAGMLNTPSLRFIRLRGTGGHGGITGSAFLSDSSGVLVYAMGLPPLPQGKTYQLWLMRRQSPGIVSGGIFKPDSNGRAFVEVDPSQFTRSVTTLAVTDEPDGGSPGPTGTKFLIGLS